MLWPCFKYFRQNLEVDKETERSNFEFLLDRIVDIKPVYLLCTAFLFPTSHRGLFTITKCFLAAR